MTIRDPLVETLISAGKAYALEVVEVAGHRREVFSGAPRTLGGLYAKGMAFGERVMVVQDDVQLTYGAVFARAAALSAALKTKFGVTRGTKVAVVMSNQAEWIISVLAITAAGGIAALVNSRGVAEEMLRAIETAQCEVAILDERCAELIGRLQMPQIVIGLDFEQLSTAQPGLNLVPDEAHPEDGGIILFTSGTTGFPKAALLSHGALAHSVSVAAFMGHLQDVRYEQENGAALPEERRSMTTPVVILGPMFHLAGIMPILRAISLGTTIHIMTKWNVDIAFDMIERVGMSRLSFVPAMLWDLLRSPRATPEMLGKVLYMANGAAALNPNLLAEIRARMPHCLLSNTYGQTETTAWTCSISGQAYLDNPGSCGWAAPGAQVQVRRDDGSQADVCEAGELWVSSAGLMSEYVGDAKATAETLQDGWLASGDIGFVDVAGIFTIVDRKKNMVISGGENIYCAEVERVLADMPGVRDCIAYGLPDERLGERLVATVVADKTLSADAVKAYCKERLAIYKVPREVMVTQEPLPRTASGKVDRGTFLRVTKSSPERGGGPPLGGGGAG
jgi:long-chain acyl-CoA synthetase